MRAGLDIQRRAGVNHHAQLALPHQLRLVRVFVIDVILRVKGNPPLRITHIREKHPNAAVVDMIARTVSGDGKSLFVSRSHKEVGIDGIDGKNRRGQLPLARAQAVVVGGRQIAVQLDPEIKVFAVLHRLRRKQHIPQAVVGITRRLITGKGHFHPHIVIRVKGIIHFGRQGIYGHAALVIYHGGSGRQLHRRYMVCRRDAGNTKFLQLGKARHGAQHPQRNQPQIFFIHGGSSGNRDYL